MLVEAAFLSIIYQMHETLLPNAATILVLRHRFYVPLSPMEDYIISYITGSGVKYQESNSATHSDARGWMCVSCYRKARPRTQLWENCRPPSQIRNQKSKRRPHWNHPKPPSPY